MTFRSLMLAGALLVGLVLAAPGTAEAKRSVYFNISPYGASIYIGPRYPRYYSHYPRSYYGHPYYRDRGHRYYNHRYYKKSNRWRYKNYYRRHRPSLYFRF